MSYPSLSGDKKHNELRIFLESLNCVLSFFSWSASIKPAVSIPLLPEERFEQVEHSSRFWKEQNLNRFQRNAERFNQTVGMRGEGGLPSYLRSSIDSTESWAHSTSHIVPGTVLSDANPIRFDNPLLKPTERIHRLLFASPSCPSLEVITASNLNMNRTQLDIK